MQKILNILLVIAAFGVFLTVSFVLFGYIILSIPPFSHAVLPDYCTYVAVGLSVLLSFLVSLFLSRKVYRRLMKREQKKSTMPVFSISLSDDAVVYENEPCALGTIKIDDFEENFYAPLTYWSVNDYRKQWREACQDLLNGCEKTALMVTMYDPEHANFLMTWPMYRSENKVYIQNTMLFLDEVSFDENNISKSISEREVVTEEGEPISEWSVSVEAIEKFVG